MRINLYKFISSLSTFIEAQIMSSGVYDDDNHNQTVNALLTLIKNLFFHQFLASMYFFLVGDFKGVET